MQHYAVVKDAPWLEPKLQPRAYATWPVPTPPWVHNGIELQCHWLLNMLQQPSCAHARAAMDFHFPPSMVLLHFGWSLLQVCRLWETRYHHPTLAGPWP